MAVGKHFLFDFYSGAGLRYRFEDNYYNTPKLNPNPNLGVKLSYNIRKIPFERKNKFNSPYFKHTITTNIFSALLREQNIAYEYRFNRNIGLEAIAGAYLIKRDISYDNAKSIKLQNSYSIYIQPKIYLGSLPDYEEGTFYVSPMFVYRNENFKEIDPYYYLNDKKAALSLLAGYQVIDHRIALNFYFGGGYHKHHFQREFLDYTGYTKDKYTSRRLAIQGGVKIGYGFKFKK